MPSDVDFASRHHRIGEHSIEINMKKPTDINRLKRRGTWRIERYNILAAAFSLRQSMALILMP